MMFLPLGILLLSAMMICNLLTFGISSRDANFSDLSGAVMYKAINPNIHLL